MNQENINSLATKGAAEKFLRYVRIDTQSDPASSTVPSTSKQKDLGNTLVAELLAMGIEDAHLDEMGYVYATIPANIDANVPVICFCSHMDTSPDSSGADVRPLIHKNYDGRDLVLPDDTNVKILLSEHPDLKDQIGNDLITASGLTLLGADDKAGIAEIMQAAELLVKNPDIEHGTIKILFTPDEEIGRGTDHVDLQKLGAAFAYTLDGERAGSIEDETFSADGATLVLHGVSAHPGFAKGKMQSAIKWAGRVLERLPQDSLSPETTSGRQGFIHPVSVQGSVENARIDFIIRDFKTEKLAEHANVVYQAAEQTAAEFPGCTFEWTVSEQYRNMKEILDRHPEIIDIGVEAIRRAGMEPEKRSIRGGTDGSRLSQLGLPCPNIFTGGHAFHSRQEWVSVQDMEKAVRTILHVAQLWAERTK